MPCLCFKNNKVRPFDMDVRVQTVVKDIDGKPRSVYLERIRYDTQNKEYIKYYKFYDPVKIHLIDKFAQ